MDQPSGLFGPHQLDLAQRPQVAGDLRVIARALAMEPDVMLFDEATSAPGAALTQFKDQPPAIAQLLSGGIDAFVVGGADAEEYVEREKALKIAAEGESLQGTAFPIKKGNSALVKAFDTKIDEIIADGTYTKFYQKWFKRPVSPKMAEIRPGLAGAIKAGATG